MKKTIALTGLFIFLQITITSCQTTTMETEKFEWLPGVGAPKGYPVEIYSGDFYNGNTWVSIPNGGILEEGWGADGMTMAVGEDFKPIPERFKITYLSFIENQFYTGEFAFPHDSVVALFKEEFNNSPYNPKESFRSIVLGFAPGGMIVIWLRSSERQIEIGRYQATKTDMDWEFFNPQGEEDRNKYVNGVLERRPETLKHKKEGVEFGLWDSYRIKYNWRPKIELKENSRLHEVFLIQFNAEFEHITKEKLSINAFLKRAIPHDILFRYYDAAGNKFAGEYFFDEKEIFNAYKEIYKNNPDQEVEFVFELSADKTKFIIYLKNATEQIELLKCRGKINRSSD
ncbi:DUF2931 family protein [Cytophaga aurantiaca]|uniref:DUF2931 family protein n=1 Tax=Cytophaga aurantiaca TaxID=29530 RepID=UPI0003A4EEB7|nr:DUF2931 family protein [Cytophaga aurantiaca]